VVKAPTELKNSVTRRLTGALGSGPGSGTGQVTPGQITHRAKI